VVDVAIEAVLADIPGDGLLELASLSNPTFAEVLDTLPGAAADLGVQLPDTFDEVHAETVAAYPVVAQMLVPILRDLAATGGPVLVLDAPTEDALGSVHVMLRDTASPSFGSGSGSTPTSPWTI
jgi:hypothetical protein